MYELKQIKASKYVSNIFSINLGFERSTFECIYRFKSPNRNTCLFSADKIEIFLSKSSKNKEHSVLGGL